MARAGFNGCTTNSAVESGDGWAIGSLTARVFDPDNRSVYGSVMGAGGNFSMARNVQGLEGLFTRAYNLVDPNTKRVGMALDCENRILRVYQDNKLLSLCIADIPCSKGVTWLAELAAKDDSVRIHNVSEEDIQRRAM